ncbi:Asparagine synthase [Dillenia turbinata]|uniref:Asparagine synthase n=1 Tax=Dillenia turbinata TaxID=194707 RepID=A0AAN8V9L2_9MAGN
MIKLLFRSSYSCLHFIQAVMKRLMTDVPFGVLLCGGLDSSLVASVASRHMAESEAACQWGSQLHTFCIHLDSMLTMEVSKANNPEKGSPDLKAAKEVADYLGTWHHEFHFTVQERIDAIEEVIYHIETYDVTTVRASTPMFLMSRKIRSLGVKMVLSGEGSDEIFGGCIFTRHLTRKNSMKKPVERYFPSNNLYELFVSECDYDVCWSGVVSVHAVCAVEGNACGVDIVSEFITTSVSLSISNVYLLLIRLKLFISMSIDPEWKMVRPDLGRIEKWLLRNAFDDEQKRYLPKVLVQKEQFSDGVGYSWIDGLKEHADKHVTDAMLMTASFIYPENTPTTKEGYYYRTIFEKFFPKNAARSTVPGGPSVACSTAKAVEWDAAWSQNLGPSGRAAFGVHAAAYTLKKLGPRIRNQ